MNALTKVQLLIAQKKTVENAQELIEEAAILLDRSRYARAYTLAHLALEELTKVSVWIALSAEVACGHQIDWSTVDKRLRDHVRKIQGAMIADYWLDDWTQFAETLQDPGQGRLAQLLSNLPQATQANALKNNSLYASEQAGTFVKPSEVIPADLARLTIERATRLLDAMQLTVEMQINDVNLLGRFVQHPLIQPILDQIDHTFETATDRDTALAQSLNETREALVKMLFSGSPEEVVAKLEAELAADPPPPTE